MTRPLRIEYPGAIYHVFSRGNASQPIFIDDIDRLTFLDLLGSTFEHYHWLCHAYCLMGNHYHLLIETLEGNLSEGMRQINGVYTRKFNRRHNRSGHLFQGRFRAVIVERDFYLLEVNRYISLNPVKSGLVPDPAEYSWSSFPAMIGLQDRPSFLTRDWILSQFSEKEDIAIQRFRDFVYDGIAQARSVEDEGEHILGSAQFKQNLQPILATSRTIREIPRIQRYVNRPELRDIFTSSTAKEKSARNAAIRTCVLEYGYTLTEVGRFLDLHYTTISKIVNQEN